MERYDLVVIGAGATGLAAARAARQSGHRVALVSVDAPGGDCTHFGCVPSKALLETAHRVAAARSGDRYGFSATVDVDFGAVMRRVHSIIGEIEEDESPARLASEGIDLVPGWATFTDETSVEVDGRRLHAERFVLATGAGAVKPPIEGLDTVEALDNRTLYDLTEQPDHLLVLGGGNIGVEMAQAFARLGSKVTVVESSDRILGKDEPEAAAVLTDVLGADGVDVRTGAGVERVSAGPTLHLSDGSTVTGTHLLVSVGRRPATDGMELDRAGVAIGKKGEIVTDEHLRTSVSHIFAAGDCTTPLQFTHVGDEQGRIAAGNALSSAPLGGRLPATLGGLRRWDPAAVPWVTFTDPEVGRVGMSEAEAFQAHGADARVAVVEAAEMDRPRTASDTAGFVKLIAAPPRVVGNKYLSKVVGMTAVGPAGGEVIAEAALAMQAGVLAGRIAQTIHAYPTHSLAVRVAAARLFGPAMGGEARAARSGG